MRSRTQKTSVVVKVEAQNFTIIRQEYMKLCNEIFIAYKLTDSARVGAALINYFESRANATYDGQKIDFEAASIPHLHDCIMKIGGISSVKRCLSALVEIGYVLKGEAVGTTKFGYDNTIKYALNVNKLNEWLINYRNSLTVPVVSHEPNPLGHVNLPKVHLNRTLGSPEPNVNKDTFKDNKTSLKQNENSNIENNNESEYIDFTDSKFNRTGAAKGLIQKYLGVLVFTSEQSKLTERMYFSIRNDLNAFNKKQGVFDKVTDEDVLNGLESALKKFFVKVTDVNKRSIKYFKACLNVTDYITADNKVDLLKHLSSKQLLQHNKTVKEKGEAYAIGVTKRYLIKKGKI
jgi:hypothetical protein